MLPTHAEGSIGVDHSVLLQGVDVSLDGVHVTSLPLAVHMLVENNEQPEGAARVGEIDGSVTRSPIAAGHLLLQQGVTISDGGVEITLVAKNLVTRHQRPHVVPRNENCGGG